MCVLRGLSNKSTDLVDMNLELDSTEVGTKYGTPSTWHRNPNPKWGVRLSQRGEGYSATSFLVFHIFFLNFFMVLSSYPVTGGGALGGE